MLTLANDNWIRGLAVTGLLSVALSGCAIDISFSVHNVTPVAAILTLDDGGPQVEDGHEVAEQALLVITGAVQDEDNAPDELLASWFLDNVEVCPAAAPDADGTVTCPIRVGVGPHQLTLEVTDPANDLGAAHVVLLGIPTEAPVISMVTPVVGGTYYSDVPVRIEGDVHDLETPDGDITVTVFLDGQEVATADPDPQGHFSLEQTLAEGTTHALKVVADDGGKTSSQTLAPLSVQPPNTAPSCAFTAPAPDSAVASGATVTLRGTVGDVNVDVGQLNVSYWSSLDGDLGTPPVTTTGETLLNASGLSLGVHRLELRVADELGATCVDPITFTVSEPPTIALSEPLNNTTFRDSELVTLRGVVSDAEDPADTLVVSFSNEAGSDLGTVTPDAGGDFVFSTAALTLGNHIITATVADTLGLTEQQQVAVLINAPPCAQAIVLSPASATTTDDLEVTFLDPACDPNGDVVTHQFHWSKDGVEVITEQQRQLSRDVTARGEVWTVEVTPQDGYDVGPSSTASVTIANTPPTLGQVTLGNGPFYEGTVLSCDVLSTADADGDEVDLTYGWTVGANPLPATSRTIDGTWFNSGDTVTCTATPTDRTDAGASGDAAPITVENSSPTVSAVAPSPASPEASASVTCSYAFDDPDGDPDLSTVEWFINGTPAGTGAALATTISEGDALRCTVTPSDGTGSGPAASGTTVVVASAPVVSNVSITPIGATAMAPLTCTYSFADPQGDADQSTVQWSIEGVVIGALSDLSPGAYVRGDRVACTVTPSDGLNAGTPVGSLITIANSSPTAPLTTLTPALPVARANDLTCEVTTPSTDDDADPLHYTFSWRRDGVPFSDPGITTTPLSSTVPAATLNDDETWACEVWADDGTAVSPSVVAAAVVLPGIRPNVSAGFSDSCAVLGNGAASCWGDPAFGKTAVPAVQLVEIDAGERHSCGIGADDLGYCWGENNVGQSTPPATTPLRKVSLARTQSCGLTFTDDIICWGAGLTPPPGLKARDFDLRGGHACAVDAAPVDPAQTLVCWGQDGVGQSSPPRGRFRQVSVGTAHSCAVSNAGSIACWGLDQDARLVAPAGLDWLRVSAGAHHSCAVHLDGTVVCWGSNAWGQTNVVPGDYVDVAAGERHSCGLTRGDQVVCWGDDTQGQVSVP